MKIGDVMKTPTLLKNNFNKITGEMPFSKPTTPVVPIDLNTFPTTHSFGYEKTFYIDPAETITASVYPAKAILFDNGAFLSDKLRDSMRVPGDLQPVRTMVKARDFGLDEYVFAYLGVHEYYYTQCRASNTPAFGAFFPADLDRTMPDSNVTLYDLQSSNAAPYQPEEMTLYPDDARSITSNEIHNKYGSDFFNYWICDDYVVNDFIDDNKWMQKREFHYKEKVDVSNLAAILWPLDLSYSPGSGPTIKTSTLVEIVEFQRQYPSIEIYKYLWINAEGYDRFTFASYLIGKDIFELGRLPSQRDFNDKFKKQFPAPVF